MSCRNYLCLVLIVLAGSIISGCTHSLDLTILHVNDTHSHVEPREISLRFNEEKTKLEAGGFPRLSAAINAHRLKHDNVLFLHAGDAVQGTLYFTCYHGQPEIQWLNWMECDAMVTGNHEYDRGSKTLSELYDTADFPMLAANVDFSADPLLKNTIKPYVLVDIAGTEVAIIGVVSQETTKTSNPDPVLTFNDPIDTLNETIKTLQQDNVEIFIVLSHCGFTTDKKIAREVPGVDLVVGGHTHSILATKDHIIDHVDGDYPTVVDGANGQPVYVVQAGSYTDRLGQLSVTIDRKGNITRCTGVAPLLVGNQWKQKHNSENYEEVDENTSKLIQTAIDSSQNVTIIEPDMEIQNKLKEFADGIEATKNEIVGSSPMEIYHQRIPDLLKGDGTGAHPYGSQLAPIVADAMLWKANQVGLGVDFAIQNAGGVRMSLPAGEISVGTIYEIMPFENTLFILEIRGEALIACFENLIKRIENPDNDGCFPYTSQMRYTVIPSAEPGNRIQSMEFTHDKTTWSPIISDELYRVATNAYLASGRDGYDLFGSADTYRYDTGFVDAEMFMEYLAAQQTLKPAEQSLISIQ